MRELLHVRSIRIHGVNVEIAIADRGENNLLSISRNDGLGIVARLLGELLQIRAVGICGKNVIAGINTPDISFGVVGLGRTLGAPQMRGRVENLLAIGIEERAGGTALAVRNHV